jgi:hypothetical protein
MSSYSKFAFFFTNPYHETMQCKQYIFKYVLLTLILSGATFGGYYFGQKKVKIAPVATVATTTAYTTTYTNEAYGYRVAYENQNIEWKNIEEGVYAYVPDISGHDTVTFYRYNDSSRNIPDVLGAVYCTETVHKAGVHNEGVDEEVVGLRADMSLREYADTIYKDKVTRDLAVIKRIQLDAKETFAGREALNFIVGENTRMTRAGALEVNHYIITENPQGKRCIIRYPEFDTAQQFDSKLSEARHHWIDSFKWISAI